MTMETAEKCADLFRHHLVVMPAKKRLLRSHPLHAEADALRVDHAQVPSETNSDEYIYDSDEDETLLRPTSSSSLLVPLAPIV